METNYLMIWEHHFLNYESFLEVSAKKSSTFAICLKPMHCGKALEKSLEYAVSKYTPAEVKSISEKKMWELFEICLLNSTSNPVQFG